MSDTGRAIEMKHVANCSCSIVDPRCVEQTLLEERPSHPWAEFLAARRRTILWMLGEGRSYREIAVALSMDPVQVQLIALP